MREGTSTNIPDALLAVVATMLAGAQKGGRQGHRALRLVGPVLAGTVGTLPGSRHAAGLWTSVAARGAEQRAVLTRRLSLVLDVLIPLAVREMLDRIDLTEVIREHVDINGLVDEVDLDQAVKRVDLDAAAQRIDPDPLVRRMDLDAAIDRIDITAIVLERVDLDAIVDRVLDHLDLAGLTQQVLEVVDMPEVIRESSGTMASDTVREIRTQGVAADQAVRRRVQRLLGHRPPVQAPG